MFLGTVTWLDLCFENNHSGSSVTCQYNYIQVLCCIEGIIRKYWTETVSVSEWFSTLSEPVTVFKNIL